MSRRILIVDDEQGIRAALGQLLEFEGYEVRTVANAVDGLAEYARFKPHLVFMDVKMAGIDGLEALKKLREQDPGAIVVMISGHATIQTAVEATQHGAYDILEKPLDTDRILVTLRNALAHLDLHEENTRLRDAVRSRFEIVGTSYAIRAVIEKIERVGKTPARVLITGENGTGKELVARAIHGQSTRAQAPFIEVNCAAIPSELIESELFGHMKGSFTGAVADRAGQVRAGARRHALPRRDRRHEPGRAGQGAARAAGRRGDAHRRHRSRSRSTCACSRRRTRTSRPRSPPAASARICSTA